MPAPAAISAVRVEVVAPSDCSSNEISYRDDENYSEQQAHMTTYLYRPGHPLASKAGFVEKNDFLMHAQGRPMAALSQPI
jgi:hypothetical protein